jgi:DNA mismatch repair protein MSH6
VRKRKKISIIDSDSEEENSVPIKPTPKKKKNQKRVASDSEEDSSDNSGKPGNKKPLLKQFAFEKTTDESSKSKGEPVSVKAAPVVGDINSNWLHNRLDFLHPDKICDAKKLRPDHPDYDSRTLYIPKSFLDKQTPAMRQWWILKSAHMDSVLFFKVGKFYELYHMDAVVGVTQLGFSYMKV